MTQEKEEALVCHGGLVTGLPPYAIGRLESPDCQNIDPADPTGATTRPGSSLYQSAASIGTGLARGLLTWTRNAGTFYLFVHHGTQVYSLNGTTVVSVKGSVSDDSHLGGFALNNLQVVLASGIAPQVSTAGSTLHDLSGTPPSLGKYGAVYVGKGWIAGDTSNPNKINFSASGNPEDWTTADDAGDVTIEKDDGDVIRGLSGTKRALHILKRSNAYILTGDTPANFRVDKLCAIGLVSEEGLDTDGQGTFFASDDGIYYAIGYNVARISDPVRTDYVGISDKSTIALAVRGEKLFIFYKDTGSQNEKALVLAYKRMMKDGIARGVWARYTGQPYQAVKTARDQSLYAVTNTGDVTIYKLDTGTSGAVSAYWRTPDCDFDDQWADKNLSRWYAFGKSPNATTTMTARFYANGASFGSDHQFVVGTTGSYWHYTAPKLVGAPAAKDHAIRLSWSGQVTFCGWRMVADVAGEGLPRR